MHTQTHWIHISALKGETMCKPSSDCKRMRVMLSFAITLCTISSKSATITNVRGRLAN